MPWKVSSVMEERLRFVGRLLDGESMSDVCREFGISRKTGYKIYSRYREHGLFALTDRSRPPRLLRRMSKRRNRATGTPLSQGVAPHDLWCADYKGEFRLGNRSWCYPLTVTDHASRFVLLCEALQTTREELALTAFERLFAERGLPLAIRSDNGVPFASPNGLFNLSKLSVWWLRLGIQIERIKPGHPQQNGRHERMHLTLKKEA